jgi:hypothetical protein
MDEAGGPFSAFACSRTQRTRWMRPAAPSACSAQSPGKAPSVLLPPPSAADNPVDLLGQRYHGERQTQTQTQTQTHSEAHREAERQRGRVVIETQRGGGQHRPSSGAVGTALPQRDDANGSNCTLRVTQEAGWRRTRTARTQEAGWWRTRTARSCEATSRAIRHHAFKTICRCKVR